MATNALAAKFTTKAESIPFAKDGQSLGIKKSPSLHELVLRTIADPDGSQTKELRLRVSRSFGNLAILDPEEGKILTAQ